MTRVIEWRKRINEEYAARKDLDPPIKVSVNDLIVQAAWLLLYNHEEEVPR